MSKPFNVDQLREFVGADANASLHDLSNPFRSSRPGFVINDLDSFRRGALSKRIAWRVAESPAIVYVHDDGIWPSGEIPDLFNRVRRSQGFMQTLEECRGELVGPDESDYLLCLIGCCFFNCWDFSVVTLNRRVIVFGTHDDEVYVDSVDPDERASFHQELIEFGLRQFF